MKAKILQIVPIMLILGNFISASCYSQNWRGSSPPNIIASWSVNINGGLTSYYGDLSIQDFNIGDKFNQESGPAMSIILTKNIFRNVIGLSGQVLTGKLKGRNDNISFKTQIVEYNLHARIDFVSLFMPKKYHAFGAVGYAGGGQFLFSTKKAVFEEGYLKSSSQETEVPEFVLFFGGGIYYKLNSNLGFTADVTLHQCQNDRLDDYIKNDDYDYFTYLSIGISYYINTIKKNKVSLANSSFLFKSAANPANCNKTNQ